MHLRSILRFIGILILFLGVSMSVPLVVSFMYQDGSTLALRYSMLITCGIGLLLFIGTKKAADTDLNHRDGVVIVTLGWLAAGLVGTFPF